MSAEPGPGPAPIDVDALLGRARGGRLRRAVAVARLALRMALHGKA
ncbi:MAG: hypothetical protein KBG28_31275 [Kofleriaceae bacterium]|nr:hypothetical protein [Kofleriaceae bacterium]